MRLVLLVASFLLAAATPAAALPPVSTPLSALTVSATTGEKPQSKVWTYAGKWWCVLPNSSGTWVWRLDGTTWTNVLKLSNSTQTHADVKPAGAVAHVLLFNGASTELASIEYVPATQTYQAWSARPANAPIALDSGTETATIDVDSQGRMWLATDRAAGSDQIVVYYSDAPYATWSGPVTLATGINADDISAVTSFPDGKIGVLWSNQNTQRFGFRTHTDGAAPSAWSVDEVPASQSALNVGAGMADDHLHVAVGSDGTLYAAVKTSYDTPGYPKIALLVRRPGGTWDNLYPVDEAGTRGIVLLDESAATVTVVYTSVEGAGNIIYRESPTSAIAFGPSASLMPGGLNDPMSTKANVSGSVVIVAGNGSIVNGVLRSNDGFTITATAGSGGTISPSGAVLVNAGSNQTFTISASTGSSIADVLVDGVSVGAVTSYAFVNVTANHTIAASFTGGGGPSGLVGWWPMDGNVTDASGNGFNATASGAPGFVTGVSGQALDLNGTSQYAYVPDSPALRMSNAITLSTWFRPGLVATQNLISKSVNGSTNGYELCLATSGTLPSSNRPFIRFNQQSSGDTYRVNAITTYSDHLNTWMHLAATYDGGTIKLYVNGVLESSMPATITIASNTLPLGIGAQVSAGNAGTRFFKGSMDDARVYNRALSAAEIAQLAGLTTYTITASAGLHGSISPSGPVVVQQGSSQSFTITPDGGYNITDVLVDGGSVGAVTSYTFTNVQTPHSITATFGSGSHTITATSGTGGSISPSGAVSVADGGSQSFAITPAPCYDIASVVVDGVPVGAVASYDFTGVTGDHTIAASFAQRSYTITASAGVNGTISPSGAVVVLCGASQTFTIAAGNGYRIADVLVDGGSVGAVASYTFSNVQGPRTISASFAVDTPESHLVGRWPMNEGSGGVLLDATANGLNANLSGGPGWVPGMEGLGLSLNGTSQFALVPDDARLDLAGPITMAAWIKPAKLGTANVIAKANFVSPLVPGYELDLSSAGKPFVRFNASDTYRVNGATSYPTDGNTWMHVAATYDGATIKLYVNGVLDGSLASSFTISANDQPLGIGAQSDGNTGRLFKGVLDDVRVYNSALSATAIQDLASHSLAVTAAHGSVARSPDQARYLHNAVVTLTANPDPGYRFVDWGGDLTGSANPATVTMAADRSVTANFVANNYTLTVAASPPAGGTVTKSPDQPTYAAGTSVQLTATPAPGYLFTGWSGDLGGSTNPATITMNANTSITAGFAPGTLSFVNAVSPSEVVSTTHPKVGVPVRITRNLATSVLGFSVDFHLSPALTAAGADVAEGTFLSGANPTTSFNVIDHGGGHFTADAVTLGPPCGASALDGLLFTVQVGSNAVGGLGAVVIDGVRLRDCSNDTLPAAAGSVATVAIDRSPPVVTLLVPNGGESWLAGSQHDVTWTATDSAGIATDGVDLELTTDGASWAAIATGLANTGSYHWTLPGTPSSTARVRVTARDTHGNPATDAGDGVFTIAAGTATTLAAAPDPGVFTETVTLTATVAPPEAGGPVEFFEGATSLGSATLSGGTASLGLSTLAVGTHVLTATYHGDAQHAPSTSPPVTLEVKAKIVASAGAGGHITPAGVTLVSLGATPSFAFAADPGQHVLTVTVDGTGVATTSPYTFAPVSANHTIDVQFAVNPPVTALSHLDAFQAPGADADGTLPLRVHWTDVLPPGSTVEVYRARFGGYARYDEAGGSEPSAPASPGELGERWVATSIHASDQTDEMNGAGARDVWFYVAFVRDSYGTYSPPSNVTIGRPNYLLGDVSDGTPGGIGIGNNVVDLADISALGASYGLTGAAVIPVSYLDVGPTMDYSVATRPRTDMAIDFEDLVMFAINFETQPSAPALAARASAAKPARAAKAGAGAATADLLVVQTPGVVEAGDEFDVPLRLEGPGDLQALSVALHWNADRVAPLSVRAGAWLTELGGVALSPKPGSADVALLGTRGSGFAGAGEVAIVRFRSLVSGDPGIGVERVVGRDRTNHPVVVAGTAAVTSVPRVEVTALAAAFPNPFRRATTIAFSLAQAGPVSVAVFGVDGRCVRTLANGTYDAGGYRLEWNGRDDRDASVPAGIYFVRMNAGGRQLIRRVACIR